MSLLERSELLSRLYKLHADILVTATFAGQCSVTETESELRLSAKIVDQQIRDFQGDERER